LGYIHKKISQELKENKRVQKDFSFLWPKIQYSSRSRGNFFGWVAIFN
jgi:hypothetical protein